MAQTIGETRNEMVADDEKIIRDILRANKHLITKYWIVIFAKKSAVNVEGKPTVTKYIKPYFKERPRSMVGLIIGEVDNSKDHIDWEVNHHDIPIDFEQIGLVEAESIAMKSTIGTSYVYN